MQVFFIVKEEKLSGGTFLDNYNRDDHKNYVQWSQVQQSLKTAGGS